MSCRNPCLRLWFLLLPNAEKGQVLILPASAFCYLGPGTRDPRWDLSTLDRAHRRDSFLFVGGDDRDVSFLDGAEKRQCRLDWLCTSQSWRSTSASRGP